MDYLLTLNRFKLDKIKLKDKISSLDSNAGYKEEDSNIIVRTILQPEKFVYLQEIAGLIILYNDWKKFEFKQLKQDCLNLCKEKNIIKYFIENKFYDKIKISSKSIYRHINPYLKHENITVDEEKGDIIHIELKKENNWLSYRLGYTTQTLYNRINYVKVDTAKFIVVIENPTLASEVGDFLRLCWIFKIPLYILTKDEEVVNEILKKAKKETKGIDYSKFELKIVNELPEKYNYVGFSKHSNLNEREMKPVLLNLQKIALIFGDDKYGLTQETRDKLEYCFRLTPELKKPLKASQALSYVLGFYTAYKL